MRSWLCLLLVACAAERESAPRDLDGLLSYTFRNWEDEAAMEDAVLGLSAWLETEGRDDDARDGFRSTELTRDDVAGLVYPDRPLRDALGVGAGSLGPDPVEAYAELLVEPDQTFLAPGSYTRYDRTILEGDVDAFLAGEGMIRTIGDIEKENVGVKIPFVQKKDYRWVHVDDDRRAIVARSWLEEESCNDGGGNCILQSYAIDVMYGHDARDTVRLTNNWMELTTSLDDVLSEDQMVAVAVNGIVAIHDNEVAWLQDR